MESGKTPDERELSLSGAEAKFYWTNRELFFLMDGVIFFKRDQGKGVVVVPGACREEVLEYCHDSKIATHQGLKRTQERISSRFFLV